MLDTILDFLSPYLEMIKPYQENILLAMLVLGLFFILLFEIKLFIRKKSKKQKRAKVSKIPLLIGILFIGIYVYSQNFDLFEKEDVSITSKDELKITFLDVGQGDAIFVDYQNFEMLIDTSTSGQGDTIIEYLTPRVDEKLDYFVATHADADHIGAASKIFDAFEIDYVVDNFSNKETKTYERYLTSKNLEGSNNVKRVDQTIKIDDDLSIELMYPNELYNDENNNSVLVLINFQGIKTLLTGDLEKEAEKDMLKKFDDVTVLKSGHHGSSTSSSEEFLKITKPEYAVISCGLDNKFGHPHEETLARYQKHDIEVYRTDEDGNVTMTIKEGVLSFETEK